MIRHLFEGNNADIEKYYGVKHNSILDGVFTVLTIDASIGPKNIQGLAKKLCQELSNEFSDKYQKNKTIRLKLLGLADIVLSETKTKDTDDYIQLICEFTKYFHQGNKKRIVLLIDELDHYSNPNELASLFRNISKNGVLICVAASSSTINSMLSGHVSLLRDTVQLNLKPLIKIEFQEIYFIANLMAKKTIQFDNAAIELMWRASGGLPYFAQLFGYLAIKELVLKYGSPEELIQMRDGRGPEIITKKFFQQILLGLHQHLANYEGCAKIICETIGNDNAEIRLLCSDSGLTKSGLNQERFESFTINKIKEECAINPLIGEVVLVEKMRIKIDDPTLKQYIRITKLGVNPIYSFRA